MRKVDPVKHEDKRREILKAAERCFARDGFQGASISDLCKEAKISHGHLYHYFASKEGIIQAIAERGLESATARFARMLEGANAVTALLAEIDDYKASHPRGSNLLVLDMLAEAGRNPAVAKIMREQSRKLRMLLADFLKKAQSRGHVDPTLDPDLTASLLLSVFDGTKSLTIRDPKVNTLKSIALLKIMITRFLAPAIL